MLAKLDIRLLLGLWLVTAGLVALIRWRKRTDGVGLVLTYLVMLAMNFWLPTMLYLLPWYWGVFDRMLVETGFLQSLYAVIGFAVGTLLLWPLLRQRVLLRPEAAAPASDDLGRSDPRLPRLLMALGLISYFVVTPLGARVPTLSALVGVLPNLLLVGIGLTCWQAWREGKPQVVAGWLLVAAIWPLITVGTSGFLGAGIAFFVTLLAFVFQFLGLRFRLIILTLVFLYLGLTVYVTYMQARTDIRSVIWSEEISLSERADAIVTGARGFEWFNPLDGDHLYWIDIRLNQGYLVGAAHYQIAAGYGRYALGDTLWDAVVMLVPRVIWQDKPLEVGGSQRVTAYTGIPFYGSTSVGMSQVLEFYVNFGTVGVVVGFALMGCLLALLDERAARYLWRGDWYRFILWYFPALSLLRPDNDLFVLIAGWVSGTVAIVLVNKLTSAILGTGAGRGAEKALHVPPGSESSSTMHR